MLTICQASVKQSVRVSHLLTLCVITVVIRFTEEDAKMQMGCVTCPRSPSKHMVEPGLQLQSVYLASLCCVVAFLFRNLQPLWGRLPGCLKCLQSLLSLSQGIPDVLLCVVTVVPRSPLLTDAYGGTKLAFGAILTIVQNWCHPHGLLLAWGEGGMLRVWSSLSLSYCSLLLGPSTNPFD